MRGEEMNGGMERLKGGAWVSFLLHAMSGQRAFLRFDVIGYRPAPSRAGRGGDDPAGVASIRGFLARVSRAHHDARGLV